MQRVRVRTRVLREFTKFLAYYMYKSICLLYVFKKKNNLSNTDKLYRDSVLEI